MSLLTFPRLDNDKLFVEWLTKENSLRFTSGPEHCRWFSSLQAHGMLRTGF